MKVETRDRFSFIQKLSILIIGAIITSFGISMYLKANFGTDPLTTFVVGISNQLNISVGRASQVSMLSVLVIIFFIDRKLIGIGTFVNTFLTGEFLNMFMKVNINPVMMEHRIPVLAIGILSFSLGLSMYVLSDLGEGPVDSIMSIIKDRFNVSVERARIILDISLVVIGYLLGAHVGIGTVFGMVLTGIIMGKVIQLVNGR